MKFLPLIQLIALGLKAMKLTPDWQVDELKLFESQEAPEDAIIFEEDFWMAGGEMNDGLFIDAEIDEEIEIEFN